MPESNADRIRRGNASKKSLGFILDLAYEIDYIKEIEQPYKRGKEGYSDDKQFKAPYLVKFDDETAWILFTTTSIRDRVKEQYWDALNLKEINPSIAKAYLVYPDSIPAHEKRTAEAKNNKIQTRGEYSPLEGIISQDKVFSFIEEYALRDKTPSQITAIRGNNFEKRLAAILSNPWNFEKWKNSDETLEGMHYEVFCNVVACLGIDKDDISEISATSDKTVIGLLPSGGPAKTDVLVTAVNNDGEESLYTISCKRSSESSVSVHQFSADAFSRVLDSSNAELKRLLNLFQACGNARDMGLVNQERLTQEIKPYINKLIKWALGGVGGEGDPHRQIANYIVVYDNNTSEVYIHSLEDYSRKIQANSNGAFGTPFGWTYQGDRGTNIQLKC